LAAITGLTLVFGLIVTLNGCQTTANEGQVTKFEGVWRCQKAADHTITFTFEGEYLRIVNVKSGTVTSDVKRHFTFTDSKITLSGGAEIPYVLEDDKLTSGEDVFVKI
jgi:hypothetical protein